MYSSQYFWFYHPASFFTNLQPLTFANVKKEKPPEGNITQTDKSHIFDWLSWKRYSLCTLLNDIITLMNAFAKFTSPCAVLHLCGLQAQWILFVCVCEVWYFTNMNVCKWVGMKVSEFSSYLFVCCCYIKFSLMTIYFPFLCPCHCGNRRNWTAVSV